jgi:hypothetical protein
MQSMPHLLREMQYKLAGFTLGHPTVFYKPTDSFPNLSLSAPMALMNVSLYLSLSVFACQKQTSTINSYIIPYISHIFLY